MKKDYVVILRDADGQPLDQWTDCYGMDEVRERIEIAREDYKHYAVLQFLVMDGDTCVSDRTYKSKVQA